MKKKSKTTDKNLKPHPAPRPGGRISFVADPAARLAYSLATDPSPLTVSLPDANPVLAALTFVITNQQPGAVEVESIAFTIQLGDDGAALAASSDNIHTTPSDPTIWNVTSSSPGADDTVTYTLGPQTGSSVTLASGDSVVLQIYNIATNNAAGVTTIEIKEMVVGSHAAFPEFNVTKFPYGFYFDGLVATVESGSAQVPVAQVDYDGSVTLLWNSSVTDVSAFQVFYATNDGQQPGKPVTTPGQWDSPPLSRDTVFTVLVTSTTVGGEPVSASMSIPVAVQQPDVVANTLQVAGAATVANCTVQTTSALQGAVTVGTAGVNANLNVNGTAAATGDVNAAGNVTAGLALNVAGAATAGSMQTPTLNVAQIATINAANVNVLGIGAWVIGVNAEGSLVFSFGANNNFVLTAAGAAFANGQQLIAAESPITISSDRGYLNGSGHFGRNANGSNAGAYWMDAGYPPDGDSNLTIHYGNPFS